MIQNMKIDNKNESFKEDAITKKNTNYNKRKLKQETKELMKNKMIKIEDTDIDEEDFNESMEEGERMHLPKLIAQLETLSAGFRSFWCKKDFRLSIV